MFKLICVGVLSFIYELLLFPCKEVCRFSYNIIAELGLIFCLFLFSVVSELYIDAIC